MSKVEMDLSEYDKMQETKALLIQANNDLKKAHEDVQRLQQEKLDVMKENEHNVTIVEKVLTFESAHHPRPDFEIRARLEQLGIPRQLTEQMSGIEGIQRNILGALFEFKKIESYQDDKEKVYSMSLHDMKEDMKRDAKNELDDITKHKIEEYDKVVKELGQIKAELARVEKENEAEVGGLATTIGELNHKLKKAEERLTEFEEKEKEFTESGVTEQIEKATHMKNLIYNIKAKSDTIFPFEGKNTAKAINKMCADFLLEHND